MSQTRAALTAPAVPSSLYRWLVCAVTWAAFTLTFVDRLAWGNLQLQVGPALGLPLAGLGVFVSAFYGGYVLANAVAGPLTDTLGPRLVLTASTVLLGLSTAAFGFAGGPGSGLAIQAVMGLSAGADYAACVKLLVAWFPPRQRGFAIGLWYTGSSIAVILTNLVVPPLAGTLGWGGAYRALGAATLAVGALCWLTLRDGPERAARVPRPDLGALLRDRDILLVSLAGFGALWGTWGFAFWSNALMVKGHGMAPAEAATVVALFGLGAAVAKPLVGLLSDALGGARRPLAIACLSGFVVMLLVFGNLGSATAFRVAAPVLGVMAFAYSPMMTALVAELAGRDLAGSASGVTNAFWQLGNLVVPLAVGLAFGATSSFLAAFATLACGPALAVAVLLMVRERPQ